MIRRWQKPYRIKKRKKDKRFFRFLILILILIGSLFYFLFFSSIFQIEKIEIVGNQKVNPQNLKKFLQDQIQKNIFGFKSESIFLLNPKKIEKSIQDQFPPVFEVDLKRRFPNQLFLEIKEREAIAIFQKNGNQFLLDREGIIFDWAKDLDLIMIENLTLKKELVFGKKVIPKENLSQILKIKDLIEKNSDLKIKKASLISEQRADFLTTEDWQIYFNLRDNLENQVSNLILVLEKEITDKKRETIKYIDLRFGNRVYYK